MTAPGPETVIVRNPDIVETRVGEQTMMMSIAQGKYYALEATAQRIWDLIDEPRALSDIVAQLMQEYAVSETDCTRDVSAFAGKLLDDGLAQTVADG